MTMLLNLYPRAWRERYEDEFLALLEARPPDVHDGIDIIRGAIDARLHPQPDAGGSLDPQVPIPYNGPWNIRRAGQVTLAGGFLFLIALWLAINGPLVPDGAQTYRDGSTGFPVFFLSILFLLLGAWAVAATLASTSRVARIFTVVGAIAGFMWAVGPWLIQFAAVLGLSLVVLAIEAARTRRWRWSDALFLIGGIAAAVAFAASVAAGVRMSSETLTYFERDLQFVALLLISPVWFATAHALLRPAIPVADPVQMTSAA